MWRRVINTAENVIYIILSRRFKKSTRDEIELKEFLLFKSYFNSFFSQHTIEIPIASILESSRKTKEYNCYQLTNEIAHKHHVAKIGYNNRKKTK